jgi:hypothetical protein
MEDRKLQQVLSNTMARYYGKSAVAKTSEDSMFASGVAKGIEIALAALQDENFLKHLDAENTKTEPIIKIIANEKPFEQKVKSQDDIDLRLVTKCKEFTSYWPLESIVAKHSAGKNSITFWFPGNRTIENIYGKFEVHVSKTDSVLQEMGCETFTTVYQIYYRDGKEHKQDITSAAEFDRFNATPLEIARFMVYYFYSRF